MTLSNIIFREEIYGYLLTAGKVKWLVLEPNNRGLGYGR